LAKFNYAHNRNLPDQFLHNVYRLPNNSIPDLALRNSKDSYDLSDMHNKSANVPTLTSTVLQLEHVVS